MPSPILHLRFGVEPKAASHSVPLSFSTESGLFDGVRLVSYEDHVDVCVQQQLMDRSCSVLSVIVGGRDSVGTVGICDVAYRRKLT